MRRMLWWPAYGREYLPQTPLGISSCISCCDIESYYLGLQKTEQGQGKRGISLKQNMWYLYQNFMQREVFMHKTSLLGGKTTGHQRVFGGLPWQTANNIKYYQIFKYNVDSSTVTELRDWKMYACRHNTKTRIYIYIYIYIYNINAVLVLRITVNTIRR